MKESVDTAKSAFILKELIVAQREEYKADMLEYNMLEKLYERTTRELQTMNNAIHLQNRKRLIKRILAAEADDIIFALSSSIDIFIFQSRDYRRRSSSAALQCRCSRR
jgi:hypothetical protein